MKLGINDIGSVYLGTNSVNSVYLGTNLVWQNAPVATAATGIGQTSFTANWNAYTGAVVYLLDVSASPTFATFIYENQQVNAPSTSYVVIGLNPNTTYYYRVRASTEALFDPDAQAFFDRVTAAEGTLSTTEQDAVNTLVVQMKADGIWSSMKAIYPMVGASAAACAQNLKSSSFTGTFTSGWTFASTGVTPNGTSAYMETGLIPSSNLSLNSTHIALYSRTDSIRTSYDYNAGNTLEIVNKWSGGIFYYCVNSNEISAGTQSSSAGFFAISRTASNSQKAYYNGSVKNTNTNSSTALSSLLLIYGALNGATKQYFTNRETAFLSAGDGLTDTEASDFYTAVQAFQTTLSRQV